MVVVQETAIFIAQSTAKSVCVYGKEKIVFGEAAVM